MLGAVVNGRKVKSMGIDKMLALGWLVMGSSGLALTAVSWMMSPGVPFLCTCFRFYFGCALIFANTNAKAFSAVISLAPLPVFTVWCAFRWCGNELFNHTLPLMSSFLLGVILCFRTDGRTALFLHQHDGLIDGLLPRLLPFMNDAEASSTIRFKVAGSLPGPTTSSIGPETKVPR